jgi:hypothetical protein
MPVRKLDEAAPSAIRETERAPPSYAFRHEHILRCTGVDLESRTTPLDRAVWSIIQWSRILIQQKPDLIFRIEDQHEKLRDFLVANGLADGTAAATPLDTSPINANKKYKGVIYPKPDVTAQDWAELPRDTRAEVEWYCRTFGYPFHDLFPPMSA